MQVTNSNSKVYSNCVSRLPLEMYALAERNCCVPRDSILPLVMCTFALYNTSHLLSNYCSHCLKEP